MRDEIIELIPSGLMGKEKGGLESQGSGILEKWGHEGCS